LVVTFQGSRGKMRETKIPEEGEEPDELTSGSGNGPILSLCSGAGNN